MRPDGKLEHALAPATSKQQREELSTAAQARAWARSSSGRDQPRKAIALWKGLVSGRWSLVDHFDNDGKQYVLACRNEPVRPASSALSAREQQVLALARLGHSNKVIAYELGLAHATVRVLVARVAKKLGVSTREQLVLERTSHDAS